MPRPKTLREVVRYLADHPEVEIHRPEHTSTRTGQVIPEERSRCRFRASAGGGLWFDASPGREHYLPIDCGMTEAETGVTLDEGGFTLVKFGIAIRVTYVG